MARRTEGTAAWAEGTGPETLASALSWQVDGATTRVDYLDGMIAQLRRLFPSDAVAWNAMDTVAHTAEVYGEPSELFEPPDSASASEVLASVTDHPMVLSYVNEDPADPSAGAPRRMSDIVSLTELHRTQAWADLLHPFRAEYQLTILHEQVRRTAGASWSFSNEHRDFTDDQVVLAGRLRPLLTGLNRAHPALGGLAGPGSSNAFDLTAREIEVLALVAEGLTAHAIGAALRITEATVRKHLEHIYRKTQCSDRLVAVERARRAGILPARQR